MNEKLKLFTSSSENLYPVNRLSINTAFKEAEHLLLLLFYGLSNAVTKKSKFTEHFEDKDYVNKTIESTDTLERFVDGASFWKRFTQEPKAPVESAEYKPDLTVCRGALKALEVHWSQGCQTLAKIHDFIFDFNSPEIMGMTHIAVRLSKASQPFCNSKVSDEHAIFHRFIEIGNTFKQDLRLVVFALIHADPAYIKSPEAKIETKDNPSSKVVGNARISFLSPLPPPPAKTLDSLNSDVFAPVEFLIYRQEPESEKMGLYL